MVTNSQFLHNKKGYLSTPFYLKLYKMEMNIIETAFVVFGLFVLIFMFLGC